MTKFSQSHTSVARQLSLPLSNLPSFDEPAGKYRRKEAVQEALKRTLRNGVMSREEIAEEMTRLCSEKITGDPGVIKASLAGSGIGVLDDKDFALFELGKIVAEERSRNKKKRQVMERLGI